MASEDDLEVSLVRSGEMVEDVEKGRQRLSVSLNSDSNDLRQPGGKRSSRSFVPQAVNLEWFETAQRTSARSSFRLMFIVLPLCGLGSLRRKKGADGSLSRFPYLNLLLAVIFMSALSYWFGNIVSGFFMYLFTPIKIRFPTPLGTWAPITGTPAETGDRFITHIDAVFPPSLIGFYLAMLVVFVVKVWIWLFTDLWRLCDPSNWDDVPPIPAKYARRWYLKAWIWMLVWILMFIVSVAGSTNMYDFREISVLWYWWYICYSFTYLGTNLVISFIFIDGLHMWVRVRDLCEKSTESFEGGDGVQAFDQFTAALDETSSYSKRWGCGGGQGVLSFYDMLFFVQVVMSLYSAMNMYYSPEVFILYFFFTFLPFTLAYVVPARLSSGELIKAAVRCQRLAGRSHDRTQLLEATNMQLLPKELKLLWGLPVTQMLLFGIASLMLAIVSFGLKNPLR